MPSEPKKAPRPGAGDRIDELAGQWSAEHPELDTEVMAVVARLLRVGRLIEAELAQFASSRGLGPNEGDILFTLRRAGEPYRLAPSALSASLLVASGTLTSRLDRLEARGLIRRLPNPADRRGLDVELTPAGVSLVDEAIGEHVANEERMLAPLDAGEREALAAITRKLLAHLESA